MMKKVLFLAVTLIFSACDRDTNDQTATLTIDNMTNTGITPLSIWSVYVTPTNSATPALDRSIDLLASVDLDAGESRSFTIDTCGQLIDVQVIFSNSTEQNVSSVAAVNCDTSYACTIDDLGVMTCN